VNAGLAKPIHANWFIPGTAFDLRQLDAAALFSHLRAWLRDHSESAEFTGKCCIAQSENFQKRIHRAPPSPTSVLFQRHRGGVSASNDSGRLPHVARG
jgi:hypothetical protein